MEDSLRRRVDCGHALLVLELVRIHALSELASGGCWLSLYIKAGYEGERHSMIVWPVLAWKASEE